SAPCRTSRPLPVEDRARRDGVALDLVHQRLARRERLHVPQPSHPLHGHRFTVQVTCKIEQMSLESASRHPERGARTLIHHAAIPLPASHFPLPGYFHP